MLAYELSCLFCLLRVIIAKKDLACLLIVFHDNENAIFVSFADIWYKIND